MPSTLNIKRKISPPIKHNDEITYAGQRYLAKQETLDELLAIGLMQQANTKKIVNANLNVSNHVNSAPSQIDPFFQGVIKINWAQKLSINPPGINANPQTCNTNLHHAADLTPFAILHQQGLENPQIHHRTTPQTSDNHNKKLVISGKGTVKRRNNKAKPGDDMQVVFRLK